jgi:hypothetical protein
LAQVSSGAEPIRDVHNNPLRYYDPTGHSATSLANREARARALAGGRSGGHWAARDRAANAALQASSGSNNLATLGVTNLVAGIGSRLALFGASIGTMGGMPIPRNTVGNSSNGSNFSDSGGSNRISANMANTISNNLAASGGANLSFGLTSGASLFGSFLSSSMSLDGKDTSQITVQANYSPNTSDANQFMSLVSREVQAEQRASGLRLWGTEEERMILLDDLRKLTNDHLFILGDGYVYALDRGIINTIRRLVGWEELPITRSLPKGTELIRSLILANHTTNVYVNAPNVSRNSVTVLDGGNASNGVGTDAFVSYDPTRESYA